MSPRSGLDGFLHPTFAPVADVLRQQLRRARGGTAACVYHRGECVLDLWGGRRDAVGRPWVRDTLAQSFSTTKGVTSTLLHILVDRGLLDYDDPVARHWPGFEQAGKAAITIRHVLCHQAGLYHIRRMIDGAERMLDWDYMIATLERARPIHEPGAQTAYHGLTYGFLVGELAQRVTGRRFSELVQTEIAEPLGLAGLFVGAPPEVLPRAAALLWPERNVLRALVAHEEGAGLGGRTLRRVSPWLEAALRRTGVRLDVASLVDALAPPGIDAFDFAAHDTLQAAIPAGNGLFDARSLARMYAALAGGGALDGVRLLSAETLARATQPQREAPGRAVLPIDMHWRLGYHGVFTTRGRPPDAFGHFGFGGSGAWADPSRRLAVALVVNSGMGTPLGDMRIARLGTAALRCAGG